MNMDLEKALRFELRAVNIRWSNTYSTLDDGERRRIYETMRDRREKKEAAEEEFRQKRAAREYEDSLPVVLNTGESVGSVGTFNRDTGGGRRVIRSTRHLGG